MIIKCLCVLFVSSYVNKNGHFPVFILSADLDDTVRSEGVGKIFEKPAQEVTPAVPKPSRLFRSISVRTHRDANGVCSFLNIILAVLHADHK